MIKENTPNSYMENGEIQLNRYFEIFNDNIVLSPYAYEILIAEYYKNKFKSALISNRIVVSSDTGKEEFDLFLEIKIKAEIISFIIECKHYSKTSKKNRIVKRGDVRAFWSRISKIYPSCKPIMSSTTSYEDSAILEAKKQKIKLIQLNYDNTLCKNILSDLLINNSTGIQFGLRVNAGNMIPSIKININKNKFENIGIEKYFCDEKMIRSKMVVDLLPFLEEKVIYEPTLNEVKLMSKNLNFLATSAFESMKFLKKRYYLFILFIASMLTLLLISGIRLIPHIISSLMKLLKF